KELGITRVLYIFVQRRNVNLPSHYDDMFISRKALTPVFSSIL
ncbi:hypothetical protein, partial [Staphylococcus aureus]